MKSNTLSLILSLAVAISVTTPLKSQEVEPTAKPSAIENDQGIAIATTEAETETNDAVTQVAYDAAYEKIIQNAAEDLTIENRVLIEQLKELPLFPEEEMIADFPTPIELTEENPEIISEYYSAIGEAYLTEAEKLTERYVQTQEKLARTKQTMGVEMFRTQDQKLETTRTRTRNKDFLFNRKVLLNRQVPSKSEKYIRPGIEQRARTSYAQESLKLKQDIESLALKGTFYTTMSLALLPEEIIEPQDR